MSGHWKADDYAAHSKGQAVWAKELIEAIGLKGDESILDIGCGEWKDYKHAQPTHERRSGRCRL